MTRFEESITVRVPAGFLFDLIHDYARRLDWDPFLRKVSVRDAANPDRALPLDNAVDVGSLIRCCARRTAGGACLDCMYISFIRPRTAAVRMVAGPWYFNSFVARMRTSPLDENTTELTGLYQFTCRPRWLAPLLEPIIRWIFSRETRQRWRALKAYAEAAFSDRPVHTEITV